MTYPSRKLRAYSTLIKDECHKYWLGGFVEGEGSLLVSIVTNPKVKHGIALLYYFLIKLNYFLLFNCFFIIYSCSTKVDQKSDEEYDNNYKPKDQESDLNNYKPVKFYRDAKQNKKAILNDFKGKSAVYCLTNKNSGRKYVGSAKELSKRLREYYNINTLINKKSKIHSALLYVGHENFNLEILEICNSLERIKKEQEYINTINPSLNILKFAGSSQGHIHSIETKIKMSIAAKNRSYTVKNNLLKRLASLEWKEQNLNHLKKLNSSEKQKKHITLLNKAKGHPVTVLNLENGLKTTYSSNLETYGTAVPGCIFISSFVAIHWPSSGLECYQMARISRSEWYSEGWHPSNIRFLR